LTSLPKGWFAHTDVTIRTYVLQSSTFLIARASPSVRLQRINSSTRNAPAVTDQSIARSRDISTKPDFVAQGKLKRMLLIKVSYLLSDQRINSPFLTSDTYHRGTYGRRIRPLRRHNAKATRLGLRSGSHRQRTTPEETVSDCVTVAAPAGKCINQQWVNV